MVNKYFPDEIITENDLYYVCYMVERVARKLHQRNRYVVNGIGRDNLIHLISVSNVLHCENPIKIEDEWIEEYNLHEGSFDISDVDKELVNEIPSPSQMGKVYMRLILDTLEDGESEIDGIIRVYNHEICETIDNYNGSAYYEPSFEIKRAYLENGF